jgi:methylthioribose-1-phosphate isomerase
MEIPPTRYFLAFIYLDQADDQIGTYQAAVLAQRHNVPFMVIAPVTTVDLSLATGAE